MPVDRTVGREKGGPPCCPKALPLLAIEIEPNERRHELRHGGVNRESAGSPAISATRKAAR